MVKVTAFVFSILAALKTTRNRIIPWDYYNKEGVDYMEAKAVLIRLVIDILLNLSSAMMQIGFNHQILDIIVTYSLCVNFLKFFSIM